MQKLPSMECVLSILVTEDRPQSVPSCRSLSVGDTGTDSGSTKGWTVGDVSCQREKLTVGVWGVRGQKALLGTFRLGKSLGVSGEAVQAEEAGEEQLQKALRQECVDKYASGGE